ncbi:MAG: hypothetical protein KatS3mg011_1544 [Acidimicrobiia bacterium]|nr:MAG: hypothetical protein KatS3mg011_1544 [Acidimicrobiia bacterium]
MTRTELARNRDVRIAWSDQGSGSPVLLIHGLGYGRWGWGPFGDRLAERFRVVSFDNRGIGESDVPPGPYTVGDMAEDAVAVLDAAEVRSALVLGASLGGMVAMELAWRYRDRVDRLVLVGTTPGGTRSYPMPSGTVRLMEEAPSLDPEVALRRFVENALGETRNPRLVDEIYRLRLANPPDPRGWQAQAAAAAGFDIAERLADIDVPALVIHGSADRVVDVRNASLLAEALPDARLVILEGAGHLCFWEQPDDVEAAVIRFFGETK